jgi:hypothetical protein
MKLLPYSDGKVPLWAIMVLIGLIILFNRKKGDDKSKTEKTNFFAKIMSLFPSRNKPLEKIAKVLATTSKTLVKFSDNVNQNTQMLKENFDKGFAEIMTKIEELPTKQFLENEIEELKKKLNEIHFQMNDFIESATKK